MYTNNREAYRQTFAHTWQKHLQGTLLEPMESEILSIILMHTEYHALLEQQDQLEQEFTPEENPFLHLSLHIAIREQVAMNRPAGVKTVYEKLLANYQSAHDVEHIMMTELAQVMWQAQQQGVAPNEEVYLERLNAVMMRSA